MFPFTTYIYCTSSHLLISLKLTGNGKGRKRKKETDRQTDRGRGNGENITSLWPNEWGGFKGFKSETHSKKKTYTQRVKQ